MGTYEPRFKSHVADVFQLAGYALQRAIAPALAQARDVLYLCLLLRLLAVGRGKTATPDSNPSRVLRPGTSCRPNMDSSHSG